MLVVPNFKFTDSVILENVTTPRRDPRRMRHELGLVYRYPRPGNGRGHRHSAQLGAGAISVNLEEEHRLAYFHAFKDFVIAQHRVRVPYPQERGPVRCLQSKVHLEVLCPASGALVWNSPTIRPVVHQRWTAGK